MDDIAKLSQKELNCLMKLLRGGKICLRSLLKKTSGPAGRWIKYFSTSRFRQALFLKEGQRFLKFLMLLIVFPKTLIYQYSVMT